MADRKIDVKEETLDEIVDMSMNVIIAEVRKHAAPDADLTDFYGALSVFAAALEVRAASAALRDGNMSMITERLK